MAWGATIQSVTTNAGNVVAQVQFTQSETGETIVETLRADDLTEQRIAEFCYLRIASLDKRDAAIAALQSKVGQAVTPQAPPTPTYRDIPSRELLAWSGQSGRLKKLKDAENNLALPSDVRNVVSAAILMIERDGTSIDLNLADRQAMLAALVSAEVFSQSDSDSLYALATN